MPSPYPKARPFACRVNWTPGKKRFIVYDQHNTELHHNLTREGAKTWMDNYVANYDVLITARKQFFSMRPTNAIIL